MCGIVGHLSKERLLHGAIDIMNGCVRHRGPDAENIFINRDEKLGLGHTRLSILDLSSRADQPMRSADGRFVIVFNGEIYNHLLLRSELLRIDTTLKFRTTSDTETLLVAFQFWGKAFVHKLEGMYAFSIYDEAEGKLIIVRDRMGKKPLYYYSDDTHFIFASELKALTANPVVADSKRINRKAIHRFLHLGYIPEPETIYDSIHKFPSGCILTIDRHHNLEFESYWRVENCIDPAPLSGNEKQLQRSLREAIEQAVEKRLISDVPLGSFLSGGTDSSLVTSIASKLVSKPLKTFNIGFKDAQFDETTYARDVARHLKTDHHEYMLSEMEAIELLHVYLQHFDEPFADTSAIPTMLVSGLAKQDVTVALTGDGGDELFLGYGSYDWANRLQSPALRQLRMLRPLIKRFGSDRYQRIFNLFEQADSRSIRSHIFSQEQYFFSDNEIRDLLANPQGYLPFEYSDCYNRRMSAAELQALFDLKYYLKDDLLTKIDRASMFYALECRSPFLDEFVVRMAINLPAHLKKRNGTSKYILKQLLKEYLPANLVNRPKWGFGIPLGRWLTGEMRFMIDEHLNPRRVEELGIFKPAYVKDLVQRFFSGSQHLYNRIWVMIIVQKWIKENG